MGVGILAIFGILGSLAFAGLASGATLTLPRTYQVQKIDTPNVTANPGAVTGGDFGIGLTGAGDLDGDGEQDFIVGTDEHGGGPGNVFLISGDDGSTVRIVTAPDSGGSGLPSSFGSYVGGIADIGSCAGGTAGQTCGLATVGAPDGVPDLLVTAIGVDVSFPDPENSNTLTPLVDAGRAYVIDGATGAVLKRVQMPAADLDEQQDAPGGAAKPAFGRTILNPAGQPPCAANGQGLGACGAEPTAVQEGDVNNDGSPDFLVSASDFFETGATANPDSECGLAGPSANCLQAGRSYMFSGAAVAGSYPDVILDTPMYTVKNPPLSRTTRTRRSTATAKAWGTRSNRSAIWGDVPSTRTPIDPRGGHCVNASSTATADGKPDILLSSHRTDDFGMFDAGVGLLLDGSNGSVLYTYRHPEPQPASLFAFSNYNRRRPVISARQPPPTSTRRRCARTTPSLAGARAT